MRVYSFREVACAYSPQDRVPSAGLYDYWTVSGVNKRDVPVWHLLRQAFTSRSFELL